jgi:hypothetical protein
MTRLCILRTYRSFSFVVDASNLHGGISRGHWNGYCTQATVSNKDVEERFKGFDECELDPTACELGL